MYRKKNHVELYVELLVFNTTFNISVLTCGLDVLVMNTTDLSHTIDFQYFSDNMGVGCLGDEYHDLSQAIDK